MILFSSMRRLILLFIVLVLLIATGFWLYLNLQASMYVTAHKANIELSDRFETKIHVGNHLQTNAKGNLDTLINMDQRLDLPLKGKYPANLQFVVETPVKVDIDYQTAIKIETTIPLAATTDLVYQKKYLPRFPLMVDIPINLEVPFHLKRSYVVPIKIMFDGKTYFVFNDVLNVPVKHQLTPKMGINDPMTMKRIADFHATMQNVERNSTANLDMKIDLPFKNVHP